MQQVVHSYDKDEFSEGKSHLVRTLLYFDIFSYPLKISEIASFVGKRNYKLIDIQNDLRELCDEEYICHENGYYFFCKNNKSNINQRESGYVHAQFMMQKAYRFSRLISWFPYVRCVCLSGSLSKAQMDRSGDIDYFIITKPDRLWIARTFLIAFKKIFLLNSRRYFCLNYFLDTNNLEIPDKNIFTATELLTLVPMYGGDIYRELIEKNTWANDLLPNQIPIDPYIAEGRSDNFVKRAVEFLLNRKAGDALDTYFMKLTLARWRAKFGHFAPEVFEQTMRSRKYVSKHHPRNFQQNVLNSLKERLNNFENTYQVHLNGNRG